jgi:hypothetical protein
MRHPLTAFPDIPTRFPQAITPQFFQDRGFPTPNREAMKMDTNAILNPNGSNILEAKNNPEHLPEHLI